MQGGAAPEVLRERQALVDDRSITPCTPTEVYESLALPISGSYFPSPFPPHDMREYRYIEKKGSTHQIFWGGRNAEVEALADCVHVQCWRHAHHTQPKSDFQLPSASNFLANWVLTLFHCGLPRSKTARFVPHIWDMSSSSGLFVSPLRLAQDETNAGGTIDYRYQGTKGILCNFMTGAELVRESAAAWHLAVRTMMKYRGTHCPGCILTHSARPLWITKTSLSHDSHKAPTWTHSSKPFFGPIVVEANPVRGVVEQKKKGRLLPLPRLSSLLESLGVPRRLVQDRLLRYDPTCCPNLLGGEAFILGSQSISYPPLSISEGAIPALLSSRDAS